MNADGTERKQLTADPFFELQPEMSPDGRYIAFRSNQQGYVIWRMNADGSNPKQLTSGNFGDFAPKFTADGQWILFSSYRWTGSMMIGKISIEGGEPVQLTDYPSFFPALSPDGKVIAAGHLDENNAPHFALISSTGGPPFKLLNVPSTVRLGQGFGWTLDGRALDYIDTHNGVSNLWSQPIDGSPPKQLTNFRSDLIFRFALSRDGRQFVLAPEAQPATSC